MRNYIFLKITLIVFISGIYKSLEGQDSIKIYSLEDVIRLTIEKNYQIQSIKILEKEVSNQSTWGNAGLLPVLSSSGGVFSSNSNNQLEFAQGVGTINNSKAVSNNYNAGVHLNYTVFDGFNNIYTFRKLQTKDKIAELQTKLVIESNLLTAIQLYFEVLINKGQLEIYQEAMSVSKSRMEKAKYKTEIGATAEYEFNNSVIDYNNDSINFLQQMIISKKTMNNLQLFIGLSPLIDVDVESVFFTKNIPSFDTLKNKAITQETSLLLSQINMQLSEVESKQSYSEYFPVVAAGFNYEYLGSQSNANIVLRSTTFGFTGNLSLNWNLFDGGKREIALQNAKLEIERNSLLMSEAQNKVVKELKDAYEMYMSNINLCNLLNINLNASENAYKRAMEYYQVGKITGIELRESQIKISRTRMVLNNLGYTNCIQFYNILRLSGELIN